MDKNANRERATFIVDQFVRPNAVNEINIAGKIRKAIMTKYEADPTGGVEVGIFDDAITAFEINVKETGSFFAFTQSEEFKKWMDKGKADAVNRSIEQSGGLV